MAFTRINEISIKQKFVSAAQAPKFQGFMKQAANTRFTIGKQILLESFDKHPATIELKGSPASKESSFVSKGNLISFLGLPNAKEEVAAVREFLRENIEMDDKANISLDKNKINYGFKITVPSKTQIYDAFPSPDNYSSQSWLEIIEKGFSSIIKYIFWSKGFNTALSRSGTGLQTKGEVKNIATYNGKPYISELIDNFIKRFKR